MTTVGAAWIKFNEETGQEYITPQFDEAILPLTITPEKRLILKNNKNKTKETSPDYFIDLYIPKPKKETDEAPF